LTNDQYLLVFGEGGHAEQMRRLTAAMLLEPTQCISIVDRAGISKGISKVELVASSLRVKGEGTVLSDLLNFLVAFTRLIRISYGLRAEYMISTGPGIAIPIALVLKARRRKVIYIETWSRFRSRSKTGRVMYYLADHFYVQNESLLKLYPKAKYSGRL